mgnify:CR=1 FL=1
MLGNFARSIAGHDKGRLYIIIEETDTLLTLVDGRQRTLEKPKQKNRKHVQVMKRCCNEELITKLRNHQTISNEKVKRAIKLYELEVSECQKSM